MKKAFDLNPWAEPGYLEDRGGHLHMDGVDLIAVGEQHATPLFVYSEKRLRGNARGLVSAFGARQGRSTVCFASKACANLAVLKLMAGEGVAIEVNSGGELAKAKHAGISPDRMVFNGVAKSRRDIEDALDPPIKAINVDSVHELERIVQVARARNVRANVALRAIPNVEGGSTAGIETGSTRSKFGMVDDEIERCVEIAATHPREIAVVGLHVHIGSQMTDLNLYLAAAQVVAEKAADLKQHFPGDLTHVNIGGGFPINYVKYNDQSPEIGYFHSELTAADVAAKVVPVLEDKLGSEIEIVTEPGRAMTSNAGLLLTRVESIKRRGDVTWLYLDAGYNVVPESSYGWYFHMLTANRTGDADTAHFRVVGPLCDSIDVYFDMEGEAKVQSLVDAVPSWADQRGILEDKLIHMPGYRELPAGTAPGDTVAILDTGAYQLELANHYCGRPRPGAVMVMEDGSVDTIRCAETHDDLWRGEEF